MLMTTPTLTRHYQLSCPACGTLAEDDGLTLDCPQPHEPALLGTRYRAGGFAPRPEEDGIFRYRDWLPVLRSQPGAGGTVVYRSRGLARTLGLRRLWIAFNGYWPERGARLETATFKELEALTVLARLPDRELVLTVPSSGNTGAAFARACSRARLPCLIIVPRAAEHRLTFREPLHPCVTIVVIEDGDYPDAISWAGQLCRPAACPAWSWRAG